MMKQEYGALQPPLEQMSEAEIVAHFARYGFTDEIGHPLENCADFLALAALAAKAG